MVAEQYYAAISAGTAAFLLGTMVGSSAQMVTTTENNYNFNISQLEYSWMCGFLSLGASTSSVPISCMIAKLGHKFSMNILIPDIICGWLLMATPLNILMLYIARFMLGVGGGAFCILVTIYTTEISPTSIRGFMGSMFQIFITIGILNAYILSVFCDLNTISYVNSIIPLFTAFLFYFAPESPYYYYMHNKLDECIRSLQRLRGEVDVTIDYKEVQFNAKHTPISNEVIWQSLKLRATRKGLFLSVPLMVLQQLSGINAIIYYHSNIIEDASIDISENVLTVIFGAIQIVTTLCSIFLIDRMGRRVLLMTSTFCMSLFTGGIGLYFYLKKYYSDEAKVIFWLPVLCSYLYIVTFSLGMGGIPWLLTAELFTLHAKYISVGIANMFHWLFCFIVTIGFFYVHNDIDVYVMFWTFSTVSLFTFFFILCFVPETRNRQFIEIEYVLQMHHGHFS